MLSADFGVCRQDLPIDHDLRQGVGEATTKRIRAGRRRHAIVGLLLDLDDRIVGALELEQIMKPVKALEDEIELPARDQFFGLALA